KRGLYRAAGRACRPDDRDDEPDLAEDRAMPPDAHRPIAVAQEDDARLGGKERGQEEAVRPALMVRDHEVRPISGWRAHEPRPEGDPKERADRGASDPLPQSHPMQVPHDAR